MAGVSGAFEPGVVSDFLNLINRISGQGSRKAILEHFKSAFAAAAGIPKRDLYAAAAHKPFPTSASAVEPRQPPEAIEGQVLAEVVPVVRGESEAGLQNAGPQRGLLEQVRGDVSQRHSD